MNSFWNNHGTKILGWLTTTLGTIGTLLLTGAFNGLLEDTSIRWLTIIVAVLTGGTGVATVQRGNVNTAQIKVADAITTALNTPPPSQGGFARPLVLVLLLAVTAPAVVMLPGCTSIGLKAPINLTQRIDNAYGNVTAVVNTAIAGRERGQLTVEEGVFISDLAKNARVVLQAADTLNKVGDTSGAEARLLLALGILQQLDSYLNGKKVTP